MGQHLKQHRSLPIDTTLGHLMLGRIALIFHLPQWLHLLALVVRSPGGVATLDASATYILQVNDISAGLPAVKVRRGELE